jgi:hypothetical protein
MLSQPSTQTVLEGKERTLTNDGTALTLRNWHSLMCSTSSRQPRKVTGSAGRTNGLDFSYIRC